ncbi:hypothetical protein [Chitinophaga sp. ARDCPP14]|uniref:hypothetical protein n=1 Tax=Chitinophaga sp. ARDCPP14 TaxID=3391139 RepID=UPI003F523408
MKTTDDTRSIFDDDPLLAEKKKFYPTLGHAWLIPVYSLVIWYLPCRINLIHLYRRC